MRKAGPLGASTQAGLGPVPAPRGLSAFCGLCCPPEVIPAAQLSPGLGAPQLLPTVSPARPHADPVRIHPGLWVRLHSATVPGCKAACLLFPLCFLSDHRSEAAAVKNASVNAHGCVRVNLQPHPTPRSHVPQMASGTAEATALPRAAGPAPFPTAASRGVFLPPCNAPRGSCLFHPLEVDGPVLTRPCPVCGCSLSVSFLQ